MRALLLAACAALTLATGAEAQPGSVPEPPGLWMGAIPGYTPSTLKGAAVVEAAAVADLVKAGGAVLIDVSEAYRKPASLPATALWRPQHRTVPDSVWFPGAGSGDLDTEREAALKARVIALAGGDLERPVVAFCHPDCWGSWNMAKRLVGWGFKRAHWFPQGIEGWQQADQPTAIVKPDAEWLATSSPVR